jgi:hypothetical protein
MADENTTTTTTAQAEQATSPATAESKNTDTSDESQQNPPPVPYQRFKAQQDAFNEAMKRLETLEKTEAARKKAAMSETERLVAERDEHAKRAADYEGRYKETLLRYEFGAAAKKLKLEFEGDAERDAFQLADTSKVEVGEDDSVKGMEDVLKALHKSKPYLFRKPQAADINATAGTGDGKRTAEQEKTWLKEIKQKYRL